MGKKIEITIISSLCDEEEQIFLKLLKKSVCEENEFPVDEVEHHKYAIVQHGFTMGFMHNKRTFFTVIVNKIPTSYLTVEHLCELNVTAQSIFEEEGTYGVKGIREKNLLHSIPISIQTTYFDVDQYPSIFSKCAHLWFSLAKDHCFINGNKRTALLASLLFLKINGYSVEFKNDELYEVSKKIASSEMNKEDIFNYLEQNAHIDMEAYEKIINEITE